MDPASNQKFLIFKNERFVKYSFVLFLVIIFIGIDQLVKHLVFTQTVLPKGITQFRNYHFAFSLLVPSWAMFLIYAIILTIALINFKKSFQRTNFFGLTAWSLLFAGAVSNIGERIIFGYVRDYIVIFNGIFNLADFFIIVGIIWLVM